jgi:hypothetical protein
LASAFSRLETSDEDLTPYDALAHPVGPQQGLDAELNDAEHWLLGIVAGNSLQRSYDAVAIIVSAHHAATKLDQSAMLCYMSAAAPGLHL